MKELRADIKNKNFKRVYLLFGEEHYLIENYEKRLRNAVVETEIMNLDVFSGKDCSVDAAIDSAQTVAFMSDYRLVVLKDTGLFAAGRKDASEKMLSFLAEIPDTTVMLFSEKDVDKRGRLYKKTVEAGRAVEFKRPSERELIDWMGRVFGESGKHISQSAARALLRTVSGDMQLLLNEMQKLISYCAEPNITEDDIESVCTKSLEAKIFELVAAVGNKEPYKALDIFNNMLLLKESPIMVLTMIARQLRMILLCKYMNENAMASGEIASALGLRSFAVSDYLRQSRNFTIDGLITAMKKVLDADMDIKSGRLGDKLAVEVLIFTLAEGRIVSAL